MPSLIRNALPPASPTPQRNDPRVAIGLSQDEIKAQAMAADRAAAQAKNAPMPAVRSAKTLPAPAPVPARAPAPAPVRTIAAPTPTRNSNFRGDTSVPNLNTIGAPMPAGGGGMPAPGTEGMPTAPLPPGATYKKGGKVNSAKYMSFSKTGKPDGMKSVTKMASGGSVSKASKRGDGIAQRGKTKGRMC